jgi:lactoylglutathione lyase
MALPRLNLLVLRVADLDRAVAFYQLLGLRFKKHEHGSGPVHFAAERDRFVFELYLATAEQPVSASTRIGFEIADVVKSVATLGAFPGARILSAPVASPWGLRAVVVDPDGHRVELSEAVAGEWFGT